MISQSTRDALGELIQVEAAAGLELKGVKEPVMGYIVRSIAPRQEEPS